MKKLFILTIVALVAFGCKAPTLDGAQRVAENCLQAVDKGDYKTVRSEYYTEEFVMAESEEKLTEKFNQLKDVTGQLESYALIENRADNETGSESITLVYEVKHNKVTTREEFLVVLEGSKHKIASHIVTNK